MTAIRGVRSWLATGDWGQYRKHPWWAALLFGPAVAAVAALIAGAAWRMLIVPGPDRLRPAADAEFGQHIRHVKHVRDAADAQDATAPKRGVEDIVAAGERAGVGGGGFGRGLRAARLDHDDRLA